MTYTWVVGIDGADVAGLILEGATINYGRTSQFEQPSAPVAVLELPTRDARPDLGAIWPEFGLSVDPRYSGYQPTYADTYAGPSTRISIGTAVYIDARTPSGYVDTYAATYEGEWLRRFTGTVQAIDYTYETVRLTCTTIETRLNRILVGQLGTGTTWPEETDIARAARIASEAGITLSIDGPAGATVIPRPENSPNEPAMQLLRTLAGDARALLYTDRTGTLHYRTNAWTGTPASLTLPSDATLLEPLAMSLELGLVRNIIEVTYGTEDPATGVRPTVTVQDTADIAINGEMAEQFTVQLATLADATAYATAKLAALSAHWLMPDTSIAMGMTTDSYRSRIGQLEQADPVTLPALMPGSPVAAYSAVVLGWTETLADPHAADDSSWTIQLHLTPAIA